MGEIKKGCLLEVNNLEVKFYYDEGVVKAVNGVNFRIEDGQSIGIVGESGCGKSVTSYSILRILSQAGKITNGEISFRKEDGEVRDLTQLPQESKEMHNIRGAEIAMIFQEPMTAFSPVHTIGNQICEAILLHQDLVKHAAREKAIELLGLVGISNPEQRVDEYSFQLSGGMRQRAMIAMALACNPRLLIADEPTTALDVTIQAQVLNLIKEMQQDFNLSLQLITHDLGVIANMVDYVYIMYLGRVVESASVMEIFNNPCHPYTRDLLKSIPKITGNLEKLSSIKGSVPDSYTLPSGCSFHPRCQELKGDICCNEVPSSSEIEDNHYVSCFLYEGVREDVKDAG